jgi:hypothetical protein
MMVELVAAVLIVTLALLGLLASYSLGYFSVNSSAKTTSAGLLANNQLELYASLPYTSIGLDATTLATVKSTDANYSTDESALPVSGTDFTISGCGASAQCLPIQTVTAGDHMVYKIETFVRLLSNPSAAAQNEKIITVIVRDVRTGTKVVTMQTGFDASAG